jgi:hypothetical protein
MSKNLSQMMETVENDKMVRWRKSLTHKCSKSILLLPLKRFNHFVNWPYFFYMTQGTDFPNVCKHVS